MTGENGYPETPEWSPEPHPSPFDTRPEAPRIPANVILGCE